MRLKGGCAYKAFKYTSPHSAGAHARSALPDDHLVSDVVREEVSEKSKERQPRNAVGR